MSFVQEKIKELEGYRPATSRPEDFAEFWLENLKKDQEVEPKLQLTPISYPLSQVEVFQASLLAGDGVILKGLYIRPSNLAGLDEVQQEEGEIPESRLPGLVRFHGYSGNRGQISELLFWALQGYAVLGLDVRGQCGETPDGRVYQSGAFSGWMTLGLDSPKNHYFRQVYLDAVRAVEGLGRQPEVDVKRIGVFGKSQGGGLAVIAAALVNGLGEKVCLQAQVKAVSAAIPFLADFRGAYKLHGEGPLAELVWYFRLLDPEHQREEEVFKVLDYFDAVNFAPWVKSSSLVSVGLKDAACPPPTVYAMYQGLSGEKALVVYPEYGHESPDSFTDRQIEFLAKTLLKKNNVLD